MSSRVQKGSTVFRPVVKARSRPAESTPSASQDKRAFHPSPEVQTNPPVEDISPAIPQPSAVLPQISLQPYIDYAPATIANTTKLGVPIVMSSSIPPVQPVIPRPPTIAPSAGPSHAVPIPEQTTLRSKESRSESLATTSAKKIRKLRRPTTPAFGADADPGEDLDPTSVTMAALCEDTGQGRISSKAGQILDNHLAWKKSNKEKRARMKMRMESKKYGRTEDGETVEASREGEPEHAPAANAAPGPSSTQLVSGTLPTTGDTFGQGFDYSQDVSTSRYNVQVRIGPNGETIVDEESLFVDRTAEEDTTEYTHVEESDVSKFINSATYSKRFRGSRWSAEETELFYDALSQFGENYELISYVLPGRDRKACKNKFKSEDKKNPQRINYCLKNRKPYDIQKLSRMTGKDFSGPTPEIRPPAVLSLGEAQNNLEGEPLVPKQTADSSSTTLEQVEEVVGDVATFDSE